MLRNYIVIFFIASTISMGQLRSQSMFCIYEDNDLFAFEGQDGAYTNGTKLAYFYVRNKLKRSFTNYLFLTAGKHSVNTNSWSLTQIMITPQDISKSVPDPTDYQYSGSLFVSRSLSSINKKRALGIQTEYIVGVMGPLALAGETQKFIHRLINNQQPKGWAYQRPNTMLLNLNVKTEKLLITPFKGSEIIFATEINIGTMFNAIQIQYLFRLGKMSRYFEGSINQIFSSNEKNKIQFYFSARPSTMIILHNTLIEGPLFGDKINSQEGEPIYMKSTPNHIIFSVDYSVVLSINKIAVSFSRKTATSLLQNLPGKDVGNISLYLKI